MARGDDARGCRARTRAKVALIKAHPDLAGKAARAGALTADSKAEQASAGLDRLSEDEFAAFHRLNDAYRKKFDIPFIVCVRRHTKDSILRQFEQRLHNNQASEHDAALREIFHIAALRLDQRVTAPERLKVQGRLSTHVVDTHAGQPAAGGSVELVELAAAGAARLIARASTNHDGRTERPLIEGRPVPIGRYGLRFAGGEYFARRHAPVSDPPFLNVVPVRFSVAEAEATPTCRCWSHRGAMRPIAAAEAAAANSTPSDAAIGKGRQTA